LTLLLAHALVGCATYEYEAAPADTRQLLAALEARHWHPVPGARRAGAEGLSGADGVESAGADGLVPEQLAAFAVTHNPSLIALRRQVGVAQALLRTAGLLSDPQIGWDAMDAIASQALDGTHSTLDAVSGLGFSITLPRPGELEAREGAARWRVEQARFDVARVEWAVVREVYVACEDVLEARRLLEQNQDIMEVAGTTRDYFERAQSAGAATAIQANLAAGDLLTIRAQRVHLEARSRATRQALNALLGLPPATELQVVAAPQPRQALAFGEGPGVASGDGSPAALDALVERALTLRPGLAALQAAYLAAEEDLRLEVALQSPQFAVGTGIWITPGFFSDFNRWQVELAMARRDALRGQLEARVHDLRRELHDASAARQEALRELHFLEAELLPNAEESLRLAGQAFDAGEVTLLEILSLQRALADGRTRTTESYAELQRRQWRLLSASGELLPRSRRDLEHESASTHDDDHAERPAR